MDSGERQVADLRVRIDRLLCVGFEDCIRVAPHVFRLDEEGIAVFVSDTDGVDRETVLSACAECPVDAIEVFAADGTRLVP